MEQWRVEVELFDQWAEIVIEAETCDEAMEIARDMTALDFIGTLKIRDMHKSMSCSLIERNQNEEN